MLEKIMLGFPLNVQKCWGFLHLGFLHWAFLLKSYILKYTYYVFPIPQSNNVPSNCPHLFSAAWRNQYTHCWYQLVLRVEPRRCHLEYLWPHRHNLHAEKYVNFTHHFIYNMNIQHIYFLKLFTWTGATNWSTAISFGIPSASPS